MSTEDIIFLTWCAGFVTGFWTQYIIEKQSIRIKKEIQKRDHGTKET